MITVSDTTRNSMHQKGYSDDQINDVLQMLSADGVEDVMEHADDLSGFSSTLMNLALALNEHSPQGTHFDYTFDGQSGEEKVMVNVLHPDVDFAVLYASAVYDHPHVKEDSEESVLLTAMGMWSLMEKTIDFVNNR